MSSFIYCPLVWMFCTKKSHNLINSTHCRALRVKLNVTSNDLEKLLDMDNSASVHIRNLKVMVIEVFKTLNYLNPEIMWNTFTLKSQPYSLRQGVSLVIPSAKTSRGINSFDFRAVLAWNNLPSNLKSETSLHRFTTSLDKWSVYCKCKLCS